MSSRLHVHTRHLNASQAEPENYFGTLESVMSATFDPATGQATLNDLVLSKIGICVVKFRIYSDPLGYEFEVQRKLSVESLAHRDMVVETSLGIEMKFDADYQLVVNSGGAPEYLSASLASRFIRDHPLIRIFNSAVRQGGHVFII
jgi:hypothetical protein